MKGRRVLMSSGNDEWETPRPLFEILNREHRFTLDAAATEQNTKCGRYFDAATDAMTAHWSGRVFCNPPYSRGKPDLFLDKALRELEENPRCERVVFLLAARTDTARFHRYIWDERVSRPRPRVQRVHFLPGRLKFELGGVQSKDPAPFPSMIVVMA